MSLKKIFGLSIVALFFALPAKGTAGIKFIDLTNPFLRKIPMAIPVFKAMTPNDGETAVVETLSDQVTTMLDFAGYFKMLDRGAFLYDPQTGGIDREQINFADWTTVGAELLITGGAVFKDGQLAVEMRLFDTFKGTLLVGKRYKGGTDDQRDMVKRFCSEVLQVLTGKSGFYFSRFAFVSKSAGNKEIYLCDFDGQNIQRLTHKNSITSFPDWSSDGRHIAFTSMNKGPSRIYVHDIKTGLENPMNLGKVQISPAWRPRRFEMAATLTVAGDEEIYLLTGGGKMIKRITNSSGIDVEPSWSPDGKMMAFVSKRAGTPQIFIKDMENNRVRRLTFEGRYNTQPSWSPRGDRIAYSSMEEGQINIYTIDIEGKNPIRLTYNQGDNEAPSWSPDGSLISFSSTREGRPRIYVMTAYGTDQRRLLVMPGEQSHPVWSPNISPK